MKKQTLINKINFLVLHIVSRLFRSKYRKLHKIKIKRGIETIEKIINGRFSIARYGDGEFSLMSGSNTDFQENNEEIKNKLRKIIENNESGLLVGLPSVWIYPWNLKYRAIEFWGAFLNNNLTENILPLINYNSTYYDSLFTRFYIDYRSKNNARKILNRVSLIWENRNVCFIEGEFSRLGLGNDLFDNAASIKRIICPATNAYNCYTQILDEAKKLPLDTLFLIALGMTATCLAYDLHRAGYQAIDIGHIDVEYEWYLMGAKSKVQLDNKYVAESNANNPRQTITDKNYLSQIIAKIGV